MTGSHGMVMVVDEVVDDVRVVVMVINVCETGMVGVVDVAVAVIDDLVCMHIRIRASPCAVATGP